VRIEYTSGLQVNVALKLEGTMTVNVKLLVTLVINFSNYIHTNTVHANYYDST